MNVLCDLQHSERLWVTMEAQLMVCFSLGVVRVCLEEQLLCGLEEQPLCGLEEQPQIGRASCRERVSSPV